MTTDWQALGLTVQQSQLLEETLNENEPAEETWQRIVKQLGDDFPSPDVMRKIWDQVFENWDDSQRPRPLWSPTLKQIQQTNVAVWAAELGIHDFNEFHAWTVESRVQFWSALVEVLGIHFEAPAAVVLEGNDASDSTWFPGSKLNIADSCFLADPDETAIIAQCPGQAIRKISYRELDAKANRIANGLVDQGFSPGDAIAVVLPMTAESVAIYLGIVKAGMAVVSIADSFASVEIESRLRIANAKSVFTYDKMMRAGKPIALFDRVRESTNLPVVVLPLESGGLDADLRPTDLSYDSFLSQSESFSSVVRGPSDVSNILFSSGTTGDPKAIPWTHLTPIKCAADGWLHQNLSKGKIAAWPTNLGWMMGPWLIYATLVNRGTIALYEDVPMGEGFGQFVQDAGVNMLGVVPTIVKAWRNSAAMEKFDWSSIECFSSTGEASQADDMFYLAALAKMKPIIEYCGGTEIGGGYITSTLAQPNVASTFSTPALGLDVELFDSEGNTTDEGEVFLLGPSIGLSESLLNRDHFETYYEGAPNSSRGGRLRKHGDFMRKLPGGYWMAGGRADDTMNLGGIKVSSAEIERVLNQLESIKETAAVGYSESGPEQLCIFAVANDSFKDSIAANELQLKMNQLLKTQLNPLFKIASITMIDSMPRTASNKVMRRKLRDQLRQTK